MTPAVIALLALAILLPPSSAQEPVPIPSHQLVAPSIDVSKMTADEALSIGNELAAARQWDACIAAFKRAGELVPTSPVPWNNAANAYVSLNRLADAEEAIKKSIAVARNGMNMVTYGNILVKMKKCASLSRLLQQLASCTHIL